MAYRDVGEGGGCKEMVLTQMCPSLAWGCEVVPGDNCLFGGTTSHDLNGFGDSQLSLCQVQLKVKLDECICDMNSSPSRASWGTGRSHWFLPPQPQDFTTFPTFSISSHYSPPCPAFPSICHTETYYSRDSRYWQNGTERKTRNPKLGQAPPYDFIT